MEPIKGSETSAFKPQTPGKYPKENILQLFCYVRLSVLTVTNNKEIRIHETIIKNEITTTTTVIYNQITETITTILVLYIFLTLIVVVNIINVYKGPLRHTR